MSVMTTELLAERPCNLALGLLQLFSQSRDLVLIGAFLVVVCSVVQLPLLGSMVVKQGMRPTPPHFDHRGVLELGGYLRHSLDLLVLPFLVSLLASDHGICTHLEKLLGFKSHAHVQQPLVIVLGLVARPGWCWQVVI